MKKEAYLMGHKKCEIKIGDKVRIKRKAKDFESGWDNSWIKDMNPAVGEIGIVIVDWNKAGFELDFPKKADIGGFSFPYFVLEKVKNSVKQKEVRMMKSKVFWVSRDKDKTCDVFFWTKKPSLNDEGQWWRNGKNAEPDFVLSSIEVACVFGVKVKVGEIKKCQVDVVTET